MSYDWINLKKKFILKTLNNEKYTLKMFAEDEKINYKTLRQNAQGWIKEKGTKQGQKRDKITQKILENQIESEVEMNRNHYKIANKLLNVIGQAVDIESLIKSPKVLNDLAKALRTLQEVQRTASGADLEKVEKELKQEQLRAIRNHVEQEETDKEDVAEELLDTLRNREIAGFNDEDVTE